MLFRSVPSEFDPAGATVSPTVGANCCRGEQTDAIGRLEFGGRWTLEVPGRDGACRYAHEVKHTNDLPRFGAPVRS